VCAHMYVCITLYVCAHMYVCITLYVCAHMYVCITLLCKHLCVYHYSVVHTHTYMCTCINITRAHRRTQTLANTQTHIYERTYSHTH